jgi:hypothetical protein
VCKESLAHWHRISPVAHCTGGTPWQLDNALPDLDECAVVSAVRLEFVFVSAMVLVSASSIMVIKRLSV